MATEASFNETNNKLFFIEPSSNLLVSYKNLIDDLQQTKFIYSYYWTNDTYSFFKNLLAALITNNNITLLDPHITKKEIDSLVSIEELTHGHEINISSLELEDLVNKILESESKIQLFTSGTTGQPKKIEHTISNLRRTTKQGIKFTSNIWGLAYSPSHMAGIQVFLQSLLNLNTTINLFRETPESIYACFTKYKITHISATPTFYRLLIHRDSEPIGNLYQLTIGGERSDSKLIDKLHLLFPNAKFKNIYASTEAGSLLRSKGLDFEIETKYTALIKIENDELLIHKSLMGQSKSLALDDDWYHTNDLVTLVSEAPLKIRFTGRKNEMINVGGFKINPQEIEDLLRTHPKVHNVSVWGRNNSVLGQLLVAKIVGKNQQALTEIELKEFLREKTQEYKVPRKFYFVDKLEMSHTGKVIHR